MRPSAFASDPARQLTTPPGMNRFAGQEYPGAERLDRLLEPYTLDAITGMDP